MIICSMVKIDNDGWSQLETGLPEDHSKLVYGLVNSFGNIDSHNSKGIFPSSLLAQKSLERTGKEYFGFLRSCER